MPHSGSSRIALACCVSTSVTRILNSSISWSPTLPPRSLASAFCSDPRWSIAAAAITPRVSDTAFMPASLPGVIFTALFYIGKPEVLDLRGGDRLRHDLLDGQIRFGPFDLVGLRLGRRMLRREERAAVLVGNNRDWIGAEPLGLRRDFLLVHADQRPQDGHPHDAADRPHVLESLRPHLADDVTGHQPPPALPPRDALGDPHHQAPVHDDAKRRRDGEHDALLCIA